jgi:hypothetical protein
MSHAPKNNQTISIGYNGLSSILIQGGFRHPNKNPHCRGLGGARAARGRGRRSAPELLLWRLDIGPVDPLSHGTDHPSGSSAKLVDGVNHPNEREPSAWLLVFVLSVLKTSEAKRVL